MTNKIRSLLGDHKTIAVIGGQWGDEGKGKIVEMFSEWAEVVARGTGGANAGHTIEVNGQKSVLHLLPSGILHDGDGKVTICGSGMAIDPESLLKELEQFPHENFQVSHKATIVMPQHFLLDHLRENRGGHGKIGTTGRGIGPAYTDRVDRKGLTINCLFDRRKLRDQLTHNLKEKEQLLSEWDQRELRQGLECSKKYGKYYQIGHGFDVEKMVDAYEQYGCFLRPFVSDTDSLMREWVGKRRILLEGAQAILLSIDLGTYPYVTSSDCSVHGLARGVGIRERDIDLTILVAKVVMTRVGIGPFPTELGGEDSERYCNDTSASKQDELEKFHVANINSASQQERGVAMRQIGNEYGATTGRPRRTGWIDLPLLRYAVDHSRPCVLALTKLDVLDKCREIQVCTGYRYVGPDTRIGEKILRKEDKITGAILDADVMRHCRPEYETFEGWMCPLRDLTTQDQLPAQLIKLIKFVETQTETKVALVSVGPDRNQTIFLD